MNHQPIIICILFGACLGVAISTTPSAAARGKLSQPSAVKYTSATPAKLNAGPAGAGAAPGWPPGQNPWNVPVGRGATPARAETPTRGVEMRPVGPRAL